MTRARRGTKVREWEDTFLASLSIHCNVSAAAKSAGVGRTTVYHRKEDNPEFAALWENAEEEALDHIELAVHTASIGGDMQSARWVLSRRRPKKWGDKLALEHSGPDGGAIPLDHGAGILEMLMADPDGRKALEAINLKLEGMVTAAALAE